MNRIDDLNIDQYTTKKITTGPITDSVLDEVDKIIQGTENNGNAQDLFNPSKGNDHKGNDFEKNDFERNDHKGNDRNGNDHKGNDFERKTDSILKPNVLSALARPEEREPEPVIGAMINEEIPVTTTLTGVQKLKMNYLDSIASNLDNLKDLGEDISRYTDSKLNVNSSLEEIESIYHILQRKIDHIEYSNYASELLISASVALGYIFNGEREFFGFKPNLKGWDREVRFKARHELRPTLMRTSQSILGNVSTNPFAMIAVHLLPSMILYAQSHSNIDNKLEEKKYFEIGNESKDEDPVIKTMEKTVI